MKPVIVGYEQIEAELKAMGFNTSGPKDYSFVCPSVEWLEEAAEWVGENYWNYEPENADCDDAAADFCQMAMISQNENPDLKGHGRAFFQCDLIISEGSTLNGIPGGSHSTCVVRCADGNWYFIERLTAKGQTKGYYEKCELSLRDGRVTPGFAYS